MANGKKTTVSGKQRKINPASLANLKRFKKGESGNPTGRPKDSGSIRNSLRRKLTCADADRIAANLIILAKKDPLKIPTDYISLYKFAVEFVIDNTDGLLAHPKPIDDFENPPPAAAPDTNGTVTGNFAGKFTFSMGEKDVDGN